MVLGKKKKKSNNNEIIPMAHDNGGKKLKRFKKKIPRDHSKWQSQPPNRQEKS